MKKLLPNWLVVCLAGLLGLSALYVSLTRTPDSTSESESEEFLRERTGAWEALQLEIEKTKDPKLGYVPKDRLLKAYQYTDQLRKRLIAARAIPGINWQERGPNNVAGRTNALLIDANDPTGNTIWAAGSTGGLWKTTNMKASNTSWAAVNDFFANLAIVTIAQDPVDPKVMYFGTGDMDVRGLGMWKSTNGGTSWAQLSATSSGGNFFDINRIIVTPARTVLVATSTGVMRSTDGGTTWSRTTTGIATEVIQATDGTIWTGLGGKIRKSTDDGLTFSADLATPVIGTSNTVLAVAPSNPQVVYAMAANGGNVGGMIRSDDGGATWTSLPIPRIVGGSNDFTRGQAWYDLEVGVDPENPSHVWIGGIDLLRSTDKGASWTPVSQWYGGFQLPYVHADQHFILFDKNNPKAAYFGCDGGVFSCTDTRATKPAFIEKNTNYNITYFYAVALHPTAASNYIMAGAQDNGTQVMNATGVSSGTEVYGGDGMFCHIDQDNPTVHIASYVYSNYQISTNGGASFRTLDNDNSGRFVNPTDWHNKTNRLYAATTAGSYRVYLNPVAGTTKKNVSVPDFGGVQVSAVTCSETVNDRVWFGLGNGTVVRVDDAAGDAPTFARLRTGSGYVSCVAVDPTDENHLLVTSSSYGAIHVSETRDNGVTWTNVTGNIPDMPVRFALFSPNDSDHALVATDIGVWSTDNLNGTTTDWAPSNSGLANVRTDMLQYRTSDRLVAAATYGRGVFTTDFFSTGPPANIPPTVTVAATPATAPAPATIGLSATATDTDGTIAKVEFYNGTTLLATDLTAPYTFSWTNVAVGSYTITAKATDDKAAVGTSAPVTVTVRDTSVNQPPVVTLTATPANAVAPATIGLAAAASDPDGSVVRVDFYTGSTLLATDQTSPYSFSWTSVPAGTYTVTARATDNKGANGTSAPVTVTVTPPSTQDISGPSCLAPNSTGVFELNAAFLLNATSFSWWYNGSIQSITPASGAPYKVTMASGNSFSAGQICVGVNYSGPPYYKSYCMNISICNAAVAPLLIAEMAQEVQVQPNPFNGGFVFRLKQAPSTLTARLFDLKGVLQQVQMTTLEAGVYQMHTAGLAAGVYYLQLQTPEGMKILKIMKE